MSHCHKRYKSEEISPPHHLHRKRQEEKTMQWLVINIEIILITNKQVGSRVSIIFIERDPKNNARRTRSRSAGSGGDNAMETFALILAPNPPNHHPTISTSKKYKKLKNHRHSQLLGPPSDHINHEKIYETQKSQTQPTLGATIPSFKTSKRLFL